MTPMGLFSRLFRKKVQESVSSYEAQKKIAVSGNEQERKDLAACPSTSREILCYMAAKDDSGDVRLILAERLSRLLPDLSQDKRGSLYKYTVEALGVLALDEVLKVRMALSSVLKDYADAPHKLVGQLARDLERQVSEPILRYCVALPDEDLLEILGGYPESWAVQAIAARPSVSQPVAGAVIGTGDIPAGQILMENEGADISLEDLKLIVEAARAYPQWQKPVAMHKNLPPELVRDLAGFVDQSVRTLLLERTDFSAEDMEEIAETVKRRKDFADCSGNDAVVRAARYLKEKRLDDEMMADAMAVRDDAFVYAALAALLRATPEAIRQIFDLKSAKAIIALCWGAGFSMRTAFRMQQDIARIPHRELIYPRGGTDYPLSEEDLLWQLDFLGFRKV